MSTVLGISGFAIASAIFAALALLLFVSWRGRLQGALLIVACVLTAIWALTEGVQPAMGGFGTTALLVTELLRDGCWLLLLSVLLQSYRHRILRSVAFSVWFAAAALAAAATISERVRSTLGFDDVATFAGLALSTVLLVFLERLYRSTETEADRSAIRYLVIGLGLMFVYDLYVYAQPLLLGGANEISLIGRGYVAALASPFIAVSARRNPAWSVQLYVSREMTFYGTAAMGIGAYLMLMAVIGYGLRVGWGPGAELAFLLGTGGVLFVLLLSPRVRRDLRVFLNKHFYRSRYDYRVEWLRFAETLSAPRDEEGLHEAVIESVARIVDAPSGLLWVKDAAGEAYEAVRAWPDAKLPNGRIAKSEPCIVFIHRTRWIIDLDQYQIDPGAYDHITLPQVWVDSEDLRLVIPLFVWDELLGLITLGGKGVRAKLNYEDHDLLKTVGNQIATYLKQDEIQRRLSVSQQFEAYHRLSAFMLHDLKNIIAQQSLVLTNAEHHKANPAFFDDAISTISNSVQRMKRMLAQIHSEEMREPRRVGLGTVLDRSLKSCAQDLPKPELFLEGNEIYVQCDPDRLAGALEHLIRNAQQATSAGGCVRVSAVSSGSKAAIRVEDDGTGMDQEFIRSNLFSPFYTTKGSKGMGIGAYEAREYIYAMGGKLRVESTPGKGTVFDIELPAA